MVSLSLLRVRRSWIIDVVVVVVVDVVVVGGFAGGRLGCLGVVDNDPAFSPVWPGDPLR